MNTKTYQKIKINVPAGSKTTISERLKNEFKYAVCPKINCEYCKYNKTVEGDLYCTRKTLTKAPQNYMFVDID